MTYLGAQILFFGVLNFLTAMYIIIKGANSMDRTNILYWLINLDMKKRFQLQFMLQTGVSFIFLGTLLIIIL